MAAHGGAPLEEPVYDDEADDGRKAGVVRIAIVAALGGFLFGYDSAVINGAVAAVEREFQADPVSLGFAVASALLGAAVGAVIAGRLADRMGRLAVMKVAAVLFLVSALVTGLAPELWILVVGRVIGGLGVGMASVIAPAYIAEIAPARIRGRLASLQQLAIVTGIFISLLVDFLFALAAGGSSEPFWFGLDAWQWMFLAMAVPAVIYGGLALTIPESPRYLVATHRVEEAREVLSRLLGPEKIETTIVRIRETMERSTTPSWRDLKSPSGRIAGIVWVGLLLSIFQQFVGINVIFYYSNILWEAVGFDESQAFVITVISATINILTTLIAIATVDRFGRKPLLIIGSIGMTVTLATMAVIFGTSPIVDGAPVLEGASGPIALVAANLFVIAFGMSWGPVVWVLLGEMFPNRMRAAALSLAAGGQWVANWVITVSFPGLKDLSLGLAYGLYATFALLSLLFVWRFVRETKGKSLEDMTESVVVVRH
ncbi:MULTISPECIES: sugar porter family MFS transporter [Microbacterium]|uniref:sugar porter family MFS transporter n=1 Tax=Microbacterium TaxID=33882 RepID=UPI00217DBED4|nr:MULTISPECIES: sugar porter family MFS transporter [Microbacterium]UWF77516.1 sugar porter family MFS transporter [Microbacterium neungamense]WCM55685.1 sugar porter family MFS transporter [Microbacterium sp. EF45047]